MPERNVELLQQTMQYIKDHPEQHRQEVWLNECGTAACFAGWAALLSGYAAHELHELMVSDVCGVAKLSTSLLGLNHREAGDMFLVNNTSAMLELMVKDLVNGDELQDWNVYYENVYYEEVHYA